MSQTQDVLVDPDQQAFDQASRDPLEVLTEGERTQAEKLIQDGHAAVTLGEAALVIGGGFLLYREFLRRRMIRALTPSITRITLQITSDYYWRQFFPVWVLTTSGAFAGAAGAMVDAHLGNVPPELLERLGEDYAERLGPYLHETSKEALAEGFSSYVNKRLPRRMAAEKAIASIGLSQRQQRALNARKAKPIVLSAADLDGEIDTQNYIDAQLVTRAKQIGDTEAFSVAQEGRQLGWMYQIKKGLLDPDVQRMWVTARDERVCKSCGPMHRVTVKVTEPFDTPVGKVWSPSLHPNCRCTMVLKATVSRNTRLVVMAKNLFGVDLHEFNEDHPREGSGRFRTKTKENEAPQAPTVPQVAQVTQVAPQIPQIAQVVAPQVTGPIPQVTDPQVALPQVGIPQVAPPQVSTPTTTAPQVAPPQVATARPEPKTEVKTQTKTKTKYSNIYPLGQDMYLVAEDQRAWGDGTRARFHNEEFLNHVEIEHQKEKAFDDRLDYETDRVMSTGKNVFFQATRADGKGPGRFFHLDRDQVKAVLEAEMLGEPDNPARAYAPNLGFDRYQNMIDMFVVGAINVDESEGDVQAYLDPNMKKVEVNGSYVVEDVGVIPEQGYPIRYVWIEPEGRHDEELD